MVGSRPAATFMKLPTSRSGPPFTAPASRSAMGTSGATGIGVSVAVVESADAAGAAPCGGVWAAAAAASDAVVLGAATTTPTVTPSATTASVTNRAWRPMVVCPAA